MANVILKRIRKIIGVEKLQNRQEEIFGMEREILSALKFNSTIAESQWLLHKSFSPGEAAVSYAFLYTLYRVLSSVKPKNILEFGLGQSSKMVHQYAHFYNAQAVTVEHDKEWVDFFLQSKEGDYPVEIKLLDLETIEIKGEKALSYKNCKDAFQGQKFDLIIVDGPFGFLPEYKKYSRPQIIELVQGSISDNFIIIVDDYNREGEKNTVNEVFRYFENNGIEYVFREYKSNKSHMLITTPKLKFLTTL